MQPYKEVDVDKWTAACKDWKAIGAGMSIIKARILFVEVADDEGDVEGTIPDWFYCIDFSVCGGGGGGGWSTLAPG